MLITSQSVVPTNVPFTRPSDTPSTTLPVVQTCHLLAPSNIPSTEHPGIMVWPSNLRVSLSSAFFNITNALATFQRPNFGNANAIATTYFRWYTQFRSVSRAWNRAKGHPTDHLLGCLLRHRNIHLTTVITISLFVSLVYPTDHHLGRLLSDAPWKHLFDNGNNDLVIRIVCLANGPSPRLSVRQRQ